MNVTKRTFAAHRKFGAELWKTVEPTLLGSLTDADDPTLWELVITAVLGRARVDSIHYTGKDAILVEIGCCSHWIRPKWKTKSGMTLPIGYNPSITCGTGFSFRSLPAFDWSLKWRLDSAVGTLDLVRGQPTRRPLTYRICMPARTARHAQATVHTIWTPGSPDDSARKWFIVYGFERTATKWRCFAQSEGEPGSRIS